MGWLKEFGFYFKLHENSLKADRRTGGRYDMIWSFNFSFSSCKAEVGGAGGIWAGAEAGTSEEALLLLRGQGSTLNRVKIGWEW